VNTFGPVYPSTVTNLANGGTPWVNPGNAATEDGHNVYCNLPANGKSSILLATGFDFGAIPDAATILGVRIEWKKKRYVPPDCADLTMRLALVGALAGTEHAITPAYWPVPLTWVSYGSATDLFGLALTAADIKNSGFGAGLAAKEMVGDSSGTIAVDACRITIYTA
jgi:hypothetical protein